MLSHKLHTEEQLLEQLGKGSETAFTELYNRYHRGIYTYLAGFVKVPQLAEDLVHEVFMKLWEMRRELAVTSSFSAYLYRVCHNKAIDTLKKIARDENLRLEVFKWLEVDLEKIQPAAISDAFYEKLYEQAIQALAPQRQRVFILCREKGRTYDEAAAELGISRNTVKEHMAAALRFLRQYLTEKGELVFALLLVEKFL